MAKDILQLQSIFCLMTAVFWLRLFRRLFVRGLTVTTTALQFSDTVFWGLSLLSVPWDSDLFKRVFACWICNDATVLYQNGRHQAGDMSVWLPPPRPWGLMGGGGAPAPVRCHTTCFVPVARLDGVSNDWFAYSQIMWHWVMRMDVSYLYV
jgi:hypothetical protein